MDFWIDVSADDVKALMAAGYGFKTAQMLLMKGQSVDELIAELPMQSPFFSRKAARNMRRRNGR